MTVASLKSHLKSARQIRRYESLSATSYKFCCVNKFSFQQSESENESVRSDGTSFVNHYANINNTLRQSWKRQKPMRNYSSYTDSEPEGSTQINLNGGQIIMNNMARSRAPLPGFSSFVWYYSLDFVIIIVRSRSSESSAVHLMICTCI